MVELSGNTNLFLSEPSVTRRERKCLPVQTHNSSTQCRVSVLKLTLEDKQAVRTCGREKKQAENQWRVELVFVWQYVCADWGGGGTRQGAVFPQCNSPMSPIGPPLSPKCPLLPNPLIINFSFKRLRVSGPSWDTGRCREVPPKPEDRRVFTAGRSKQSVGSFPWK